MNKKLPKISILVAIMVFTFSGLPVFGQATSSTDGSNDSPTQRIQYVRDWRGQSGDMQQKIQALGSIPTTTVTIPVLLGVELSSLRSDFGDPRSNGRTHIGNDLIAVRGTPIVSPTSAVVLRTGVGAGEGNYVYTANPGGETFVYMHLDKFGEGVSQGTVLEKGSLIGYVGSTGNAAGTAPHLHFEIHDSNGVAVDPFLRINATFTIAEKMQYLNKIFLANADSNNFAQVLATNFRSTFNQAITLGISFPEAIKNYLSSLPVTPPPSGRSLPAGDLTVGSKGDEVVKLQQYLILKNIGSSAVRLSQAGATGSFGSITQAALVEYQISSGISPADGYYGGTTRTRIEANPIVTPTPTTPPSGSISFTRDLSLNSNGEDVRAFQKFLNSRGYIVSSTGAGSVGNETSYFGLATRAAVIKFQLAKNINPALGYVGPLTRAVIASSGM